MLSRYFQLIQDELDVATELLVTYQTELHVTQEAHVMAVSLLVANAEKVINETFNDLAIFRSMMDEEHSGLFYLPPPDRPIVARRSWKFEKEWDSEDDVSDSECWWRSANVKKVEESAKNYFSGVAITPPKSPKQYVAKSSSMKPMVPVVRRRRHALIDPSSESAILEMQLSTQSEIGAGNKPSGVVRVQSTHSEIGLRRMPVTPGPSSWLSPLTNFVKTALPFSPPATIPAHGVKVSSSQVFRFDDMTDDTLHTLGSFQTANSSARSSIEDISLENVDISYDEPQLSNVLDDDEKTKRGKAVKSVHVGPRSSSLLSWGTWLGGGGS
jgi:hypothetical protein